MFKSNSTFFSNLKIGQRLTLGFGILIVLTLLVGAVSFAATNAQAQSLEQVLDAHDTADLVQQMTFQLLEAEELQLDFLLHWRTEGFQQAYDNYVVGNQEETQAFRETIAQTRLVENEEEILELLDDIEREVLAYEPLFILLVSRIEQRGFIDTGLEGRFRDAAHALESSPVVASNPELLISLLQMRRNEKDYLLRGLQVDVNETARFTIQFQNQIRTLPILPEQQQELINLSNTYLVGFMQLAGLDRQIASDDAALRADIHAIEPSLATIVANENEEADEQLANLRATEQVAQTLSTALLILVTVAGIVLAFIIRRSITRPLIEVTDVAAALSAGDLNRRANVISRDEIGVLAQTFNAMAQQIQDVVANLERRVAARTTDLAITVEVGSLAMSIRNQEELLPKIVEFIRARFGLYYTQIYLLDEAKRFAHLRAGTGKVGEQLLGRSHRLDMDDVSLVATAVRTGEPVLVSDTETNTLHKKNTLLPDTRSEISIPLVVGDDILGVLDMQAVTPGTFNQDNIGVFQAMANQLAAALRSAQAYDEARLAIDRTETINRRLTSTTWQPYLEQLADGRPMGYEYNLETARPLEAGIQALNGANAAVALTHAIALRGQSIGKVVIQDEEEREWTAEELALVASVTERVALALEQFRAFDQTKAALSQTEALYTASEHLGQATTIDEVLQALIQTTSLQQLDRVSMVLFDRPNSEEQPPSIVTVTALWQQDGGEGGSPVGTVYPFERYSILSLITEDTSLVVSDIMTDPRVDDTTRTLLERLGNRRIAIFPLVAGDEWIGVLTGQAHEPGKWQEDDVRQIGSLTDQAATIVQNLRLYEQTQVALTQTEALYAGSERLNRAATAAEVLQALVDSTFLGQLEQAGISLFNRPWVGDDRPEILLTAAQWMLSGGESPLPVGTTFPVEHFPMLALIGRDSPFIVADTTTDPRLDENARAVLQQIQGRSLLLFPLAVGDEWLGILSGQASESRSFPDDAVRQISSLTGQAATIIQNLRLFEEAEAAREEANTLYEIGVLISEAEDEQQIVDAFVQHMVGPEIASVSMNVWENGDFDTAKTFQIPAGWWRDPGMEFRGFTMQLSDFPFTALIDRHDITLFDNVQTDPRIDEQSAQALRMFKTGAFVLAPMTIGERFIGTVAISSNEPRVHGEREIRMLRSLADQMTTAIERLRLSRQTEKRAAEMETVAMVSSAVTTLMEVDSLLEAVANLTNDSFNLYHAHVYLLDADNLVLAGGAGEAGRIMKEQRRSIALDHPHSLVASAGRTQAAIIVNDVTQNPDFLPHPLLPETKSEMAIPMMVGDDLIGVMDVQDNAANRFTDDDVRVMSTLAAQIAIAVQNARAYQQTQTALQSLDRVYTMSVDLIGSANFEGYFTYLNPAWETTTGWTLDELRAKPFIEFVNPEDVDKTNAEAAKIAEGATAIFFENRYQCKDGSWKWISWNATPDIPNALIHFVARDISEAKLAEEERQILFEAATNLNNVRTSQDVMDAVNHWARSLGCTSTSLMYVESDRNNQPEWIEVAANWTTLSGASAPEGSRFYLPEFPFARLWISNPDEPTLVGDVETDPRVDETTRSLVMQSGGHAMAVLPLRTQKRWVAIMIFTWQEAVAFSKRDERIFTAMAQQATSAVDALRSAEATRQARDEAEILYSISNQLTTARSLEELLAATSRYAQGKNVYSASLMYIDTDKNDQPEWAEIVASWETEGAVTAPVGSRFYLPELPFAKVWTANPHDVTLEGDALNAESMDEGTRELFKQFGIAGIALLPLYTKGNWIGLLSFTWGATTTFTEQDHRVFSSIMRQTTSVVDAMRSSALTQKRALELATVAQVSAAATTILDVEALLQQVSDLTKLSFNLYHVHVYLLEDNKLVLAAGAGDVGRTMRAQGRSIPVSQVNSLVARTARERKGVIVNDVTQNPDFLPNPLLPDTKSEMAIPMLVGDQLVGVLDVQGSVANRFNDEDVQIMSTLAAQIAIAVRNARAFELERQTSERLREVDRLKSQFLANMSHELRTPLNSIIGYSEVLLDGGDGDLSDEATEDVETIHGSGQHLLAIINDILDLAKIEAGQMQISRQDADLTRFLTEIVHAGQILVKDKPVTLTLIEEAELPHVHADPIRLRQIVWNLVSNAVKFTEKGDVTVSVGVYDEKQVYVKVTDSGIGIKAEDVGVVFDQFRQVDGSSTRRAGGTGLGLTITRHLIRLHGGEIYVESEFGVGSTFWFTLPLYTRVNN